MRESIQLLQSEVPWFLTGFFFVIGACVGSFLNVVIYRLPKGESVVFPGSHCACGKPIPFYRNIPILSWFLLRGKAACCGRSIAFRYPFVELLTATLFALCWWHYPSAAGPVFMIFVSLMVAQAFIDLDTMEIPDFFSVGGFLIGLTASIIVPLIHGYDSGFWLGDALRSFVDALLGGLIGSALILWIALIAEIVLRKEAMGFGDVKLMGAIGVFCGWQGAVFAIFGGAVLGSVAVLIASLFNAVTGRSAAKAGLTHGEGERRLDDSTGNVEDNSVRIPFGPALAGGAIIYVLFMSAPVDRYFRNFAEILFQS